MRLWVHEAHWLLGFCSSGSSLNGALVAAATAGIILLCYLRSDFREQGHCIVEYLGIGIRLAWCYNSPLWIVMGCKQSRMKLSPIISLLREEDVNKIAPLTKKKKMADDSPFCLVYGWIYHAGFSWITVATATATRAAAISTAFGGSTDQGELWTKYLTFLVQAQLDGLPIPGF